MPNSQDTIGSRSTNCMSCAARVNAVCPRGDRCLIQNVGPESGVQYAHLVPRALAQDDDLVNIIDLACISCAYLTSCSTDEQAGVVLGNDTPHNQFGHLLQYVPM